MFHLASSHWRQSRDLDHNYFNGVTFKKRLYFFIFFIILIFQPFWPAEVLGHFLKFMVMYKVFRVIYKCKWSKWMYIFPKLTPDTLYSNIRIIIKRMEFTQQRNILVWLLIFYFLPRLRIICENKFFFTTEDSCSTNFVFHYIIFNLLYTKWLRFI